MTRTVRLRPWQKAAFDRFVASDAKDFLAVATPGAGKTTFALTAARHALAQHPTRLVVVSSPVEGAHGIGKVRMKIKRYLD